MVEKRSIYRRLGGGAECDLAGIRTHSSVSSFSGESESGFLSALSAASSSRPWLRAEEEECGSRRGRLWVFFFSKKMKMSSIPRSFLLSGRLSMAAIEAVHRRRPGGWRDACLSAAAAASLPAPPPLLRFWQLADDNRWWVLITSSQRKMNSYPASSRAVFAVREAAADEEEAKLLLCWGLSTPPSLFNPAFCHVHTVCPKNKCEH